MSDNNSRDFGKNEHIEILRALAVSSVFVLHMQFAPYYFVGQDFLDIYGYLGLQSGVDLFLVISGFVITSSLLRYRESQSAPRSKVILSFWLRRIYRLLPTAWFWLFIVLLYRLLDFALFGSWGELWRDLISIAAAFLNVMNLYASYCGFVSVSDLCAPNIIAHGHYWSLSLEEQFYLIFPLLFFLLARKWFLGFIILAIALQFFWHRPLFSLFYYLKTDALCWGVLIALATQTAAYESVKAFFRAHSILSAIVALSLLFALPLVSFHVSQLFVVTRYGVGLIALISAGIVLFASFEFLAIDKSRTIDKIFLYIGSRSYAIYITHMIVILLIGRLNTFYDPGIESVPLQHLFDWMLCAIALAITLVLSELNYRKIEVPWREKGREISKRMLKADA